MSTPHNSNDAWLAVQYVLGELSAPATADFEARLADEADLCQHVAEAGRLIATLEAAPLVSTAASAAPVPRKKLAGATALAAAAACLTLAVLPRSEPDRPDSAGTRANLLSLWRGQGDALRSASGDVADVCDDDREWAADQVPSWMIAAVSLERRTLPPGENEEVWEDN